MVESTDTALLKMKLYSLIEQMSHGDLKKAREYLETLHYDSSMLTAIHKSKTSYKPGDTFTKDEAIQILYFAQEDN